MIQEPERELARITHADIGDVYNGMLGLLVEFEYDGSDCQRLSDYLLDAAMVVRFLRAVGGCSKLSDAVGRSVWVTHTHDSIKKIEPLHQKDGKPFVIAEWEEWVCARLPEVSWSELESGNDPSDAYPRRGPLERTEPILRMLKHASLTPEQAEAIREAVSGATA